MKRTLSLLLLAAFFIISCKKNNSSTPPPVTTVSNTVDTLAGTRFQGSTNGPGKQASFNFPTGIAVDASGNVYVADNGNNLIRKITSAGVVSTFAGTGAQGSANGAAAQATFNAPYGVAVDASGNIYVTDNGNNLIRKITSTGAVSIFAGTGAQGSANGAAAQATFFELYGIAVDASGNVYVADSGNNLIRKITQAGIVTTFATGFTEPTGVAVDAAGNVYVADSGNIREITPAGVVSNLVTMEGLGIAVDAKGNVYVGDGVNSLISKIPAGGGAATTLASAINGPYGVAVDATGNVYVADGYDYLILKILQK